jgi:receptor protein-tyrosine kinase
MSIVERAIAKAEALGRAKGDPGAQSTPPPRTPSSTVERKPLTPKGSVELRLDTLHESGLIAPKDMERVMAEELRLIKRPLLLNAEADAQVPNGSLVMIASALPGAGKTFLAFNLALSMATEPDWTVLLIDGDYSRPTLTRGFGLAEAPGLVDLLENERGTLADYVLKTDRPGLHFLPAGPSRPEAKELLGSQRMRAIMASLASPGERRIVVLDSPPLLLTSEARVLASYAGQIALVVEAGKTPRRSLLEAIEVLDSSKAISLILNKSRFLPGVGDYRYEGYGAYGAPHVDN